MATAAPTTNTLEDLILDLLEWVAIRQRTYDETLDAWRTSCPRFPVWEDATDRRLVETIRDGGRIVVRVTPNGHALLNERRSPESRLHQATARS